MSLQDTNGRGVKTLAIRLEPEMHAQLTLIAQLRGTSVTDEFRTALEAHIAAAKTAPDLATQADSALQAVEAEAAARREAISQLFGSTPSPTGNEPNPDTTSRARARKPE